MIENPQLRQRQIAMENVRDEYRDDFLDYGDPRQGADRFVGEDDDHPAPTPSQPSAPILDRAMLGLLREVAEEEEDPNVVRPWNPPPPPRQPDDPPLVPRDRPPLYQPVHIPDVRHGDPKITGAYAPNVREGWWFRTAQDLNAYPGPKRNAFFHSSRIMETDLGEWHQNDPCTHCANAGHECWSYSDRGIRNIAQGSKICARCRVRPGQGGCSLVQDDKRKGRKKKARSPPPPSRDIRPKPPGPPPPPPPMGGQGIAAF